MLHMNMLKPYHKRAEEVAVICAPASEDFDILHLPNLLRDGSQSASHYDIQGCSLHGSDLVEMLEEGDILIGVVLPFHIYKEYHKIMFTERPPQGSCKIFSFEVFQQFHAMKFAFDEINRSPTLLPNLTLGFQVYDSCSGIQEELDGTLKMLTGQKQGVPNFLCKKLSPVSSIIGHSMSSFSILNAHVLGLYRYPQVSYLSTSSVLSDKTHFPSFFRTVPSDAFQIKGLAQLVLHFGWTWVGLVAVDDDYGHQGIPALKQEILRGGACVAFTEYITTNRMEQIPHLTKIVKESTAKVVIVFTTDGETMLLLDEMLRQNVTSKLFVASEAWSISKMLSVNKYSSLLSGAIGLSFQSSTIPGFGQFVNSINPFKNTEDPWTNIFWKKALGCKKCDHTNVTVSWDNFTFCTGNESMESIQDSFYDVSNLRSAYNLYKAVHVIAKSLDDMKKCRKDKGPFYNGSCPDFHDFKPWQLSYYVQQVRLTLDNGQEHFFDMNGDPPAVYDIVNWQMRADGTIRHIKVGGYDTTKAKENVFHINATAVQWSSYEGQVYCENSVDCFKCPWNMWPNDQKDTCLLKNREFLSIEEPLGAALAATSVLSSLLPISIVGLFMCYKNTPIVRANNLSLSCLLLMSMSLCFLSSLAFIGYPQREKCIFRQVAFGTVFTLCVSCILAKTLMVVFAFMATKPGSSLKRWAKPLVSYMIIFVSFFLQLIVCISWISFAPPFPTNNIQTKPGIIIVECDEGSPTAFWCMLGYLSLLATISFIVAFLARRLPDSFNEAKFITFSMLAFLSVWVSYIPASLSSTGKYTVAMEIFAILSSSWALLSCMFVQKCFIILFRPELNSKVHLMGKSQN
ncbi:extracellular calcium-sensing receptor-like [Pelobates fuscus]|uniref:extracellular calcium-sensing receptor-like n=1 Tax=Pelobates fuscus TaxID=191477 RepID=UPI002FE496D9